MNEQAAADQHHNGTQGDALRQMATRHHKKLAQDRAAFAAALRVAFGRMCSDCPGLDGVVQDIAISEGSLSEVLDLADPGMFLALLDGPEDRIGLLLACPAVLASMIEAQTTGRVDHAPAPQRKPTRTDAALLSPLVDAFLGRMEQRCADLPQAAQVAGFAYGSFLDDPRPLALMLEEGMFSILQFQVALGFGARTGHWTVILPVPVTLASDDQCADGPGREDDWAARMQATVAASPVLVDAVLCRMKITLTEALRLRPGDVLRVPETALETLSLEGIGPVPLAVGRLGQARGQRAARLTADPGDLLDDTGAQPMSRYLTASVMPMRPLQPAFVPAGGAAEIDGLTASQAPDQAPDQAPEHAMFENTDQGTPQTHPARPGLQPQEGVQEAQDPE